MPRALRGRRSPLQLRGHAVLPLIRLSLTRSEVRAAARSRTPQAAGHASASPSPRPHDGGVADDVHVGRACRRRRLEAPPAGPMSAVVSVSLVTRLPPTSVSRIVTGCRGPAAPSRTPSGSPTGSCAVTSLPAMTVRSIVVGMPSATRTPAACACMSMQRRRRRRRAACWSGPSRCRRPACRGSSAPARAPTSTPPPSAKRPFGAATTRGCARAWSRRWSGCRASLQIAGAVRVAGDRTAGRVVADHACRAASSCPSCRCPPPFASAYGQWPPGHAAPLGLGHVVGRRRAVAADHAVADRHRRARRMPAAGRDEDAAAERQEGLAEARSACARR